MSSATSLLFPVISTPSTTAFNKVTHLARIVFNIEFNSDQDILFHFFFAIACGIEELSNLNKLDKLQRWSPLQLTQALLRT